MKRLLLLSMLTFKVFTAELDLNTYSTDLKFAQVTHVVATQQSDSSWCFSTSVRHNDQGWKHYANAWSIEDLQGNQLGYRRLGHPHDNEQPFTRNQCNISIPPNISKVIVQAKCNNHGYGGKAILIDLNKAKDENYIVRKAI
ncbi:hypothetical protein C1E23_18700 [Pseudoalteromonas phenolica]|uniref:Uncharacterized protein n=1 Tax=Pseudoalteromonas phenolica TaxID=161398 RepID=A0A4Q7IKY4_9GAMM|nr:hypothetical protein [Pseudoalteromonas phenolica]RZQ51587.1 hypothetical protein C1E23_18700 [Pseudoalteromonas phenolica]